MKRTKFARVLSMLLALLMLMPGVFSALPAAAAESSGGEIDTSDAPALSDSLNASGYETYLSSIVASLRYDQSARPAILIGAFYDGLDEERGQAGVLHTILQDLIKNGSVSQINVDTESEVLALDEATKTKIIVKLTDEQIIKYLRGTEALAEINLMEYAASGDEGQTRPAVETDFLVADHLRDNSIFLADLGSVTWSFNVPEGKQGFYTIEFEYYPVVDGVSTIERMMHVDGEILFSEARSLKFTKNWEYSYYDKNKDGVADYEQGKHAFRQDKTGNDMRPEIEQKPVWRTYACSDAEGFYADSFEIYFEAGDHTISLTGVRENLVIGSIKLVPAEPLPSYEEYISEMERLSGGHVYGSTVKTIQAETPSAVSDTSVYAANDRSSPINQPSSASSQWYNVIGRESYSAMGQWASYDFTVDSDGFYAIASRYHQNLLEGMFVSRSVKLWSSDGMYGLADGTPTLPFAEANEARYEYDSDWQTSYVGNGSYEYEFYFKAGVQYKIVFEVSLGQLAEIIEAVQSSLSTINACYLNILKLTGANPDEYRNYNFTQIMPGTVRNLLLESINLTKVSKQLEKICGEKGSHVATLDRVALLLNRMGSDESEIASGLSELKTHIGTLGTWINSSKAQGLPTDYFQIQSIKKELPRAGANLWDSISFEVVSFFSSFVVDYNSMGVSVDDGREPDASIEVWLATGRDQSLIWRTLIDNQFSSNEERDTKIAVQLKLVAGGTLLPSVLAGQGPDVYIGSASADAINYAIRSAVLPIQDLDPAGFAERLGYDEYIEETNTYIDYDYYDETTDTVYDREVSTKDVYFNYANMVPLSLYGRTYGLPETTNFPMLFYRKDVLSEMGVDIDEMRTWDDILSITPTFQANNMEIGIGYAGAINIFIYQNGGSLWLYEDSDVYNERWAGSQIGLGTNEALSAFKNLVRFYTDYSYSVTFDAANRFRTGEMPMMLADYCATYNQLVVFASEISGMWEFTSLPGTLRTDKNGNEIIDRRSVASVTAVTMMEGCSDKASAWEFMKWQCGEDVQAQYGNEMVALVGPAAKYATANMQALKGLSWSTAEYRALVDQFEQLAAVPNYPGSYIIARYTNFAFLDAVNNGTDPVEALQGYITIINKELYRKREEFNGKKFEDGSSFDVPLVEPGDKAPTKQEEAEMAATAKK